MAAVTPLYIAPKRESLFEITEHLDALLDTLDLCEDPELRVQCEREIDEYLSRQIAKVDHMAEFQDHLDAQIAMRKKQVQLLEKANRRSAAILERIDNAILRTIEVTGRKSLDGSLYSFAVRKLLPSVDVLNQAVVPQQYLRVTVSESVDKTAAKVDLRAGIEIPGLRLLTDKKGVVRK